LYAGREAYFNLSEELATASLRVVEDVYCSRNMLKMEAANSTATLCLCTHVYGVILQNTGTVITKAERTAYLAVFAFCNDLL
jgi:hypothetical protein